ncbi:inactive anthranilate O-methyltransferase 1 [Brachypodium distachyon]|uniref:Jasmonate O-methyltransferase n=1 Tax=Brachypodium distachyon TaxID=15368 RepID=I1IET0_BRADI|nr:inactive anthranilate O-methyltransferase 1 [Brachypodium distachyon]KQK01723.1 hypothetical protein BRADI_3g57790v3 [Brachypodium distachyon]|eukprot:XP_003573041.1 inactive anthranilate O-methyltransferase 1 [Brachypodium distachyon]
MASQQTVFMNHGQGETSYARNSSIQNADQERMKPMIEAAIAELCTANNGLSRGNIVIADLGCSSGPNALTLVSFAVEAIHKHYLELQQPPPELCVLLNDLPDNDFNTVVKNLTTLRRSDEPVVVTGVTPGSFYERLFTAESLHLACSSNSLHWLSKAPEDLTRNQIPAYDIDEHARRERLPLVVEAYANQFKKDFTLFLKLRAKESVPGGKIVVSLLGRRSEGISSKFPRLVEILLQILSVTASEGVFEKKKLNSFYVPVYEPSDEELREIIQEEGSFWINEMCVHGLTSGMDSALITPNRLANQMRAVFEPLVAQHLGDVMDEFVRTAEQRWSLEGSLQDEVARLATVAVSLTKA